MRTQHINGQRRHLAGMYFGRLSNSQQPLRRPVRVDKRSHRLLSSRSSNTGRVLWRGHFEAAKAASETYRSMPTYAILLLCIVSAASGRSLSQAVASPQAGAAQVRTGSGT